MIGERERLAESRRAARRALAQGRQWYLRGVLMIVVALVAFYRGGQINVVVGVVLVVLSVMSAHLGRQLRRQAAEMERKIGMMEQDTEGPADHRTDTAAQRDG